MFGLLCCLEEPDRILPVIEGNWADLWQRLSLPGTAPDQGAALEPLASQGLIAPATGTGGDQDGYQVHPGVAAAGRAQAGGAFQAAVDHEAAAYWHTLFQQAYEQETGWLIVRAGRAAVPYLLRLGEQRRALTLLEQVLHRDSSPATIAALLPVLRQIADTAQGSDDETAAGLLVARALEDIDPEASARQLRSLLTAAVERGDYNGASVISAFLINNYQAAGRLDEALTLADEMAEYSRRAGLGPWTQLSDAVMRLQILNEQGRAEQVLDEVTRLQQQIGELPEQSDRPEAVEPYNVRESILDAGRFAARQLERWDDALAFNADLLESKERRGASALEVARQRSNDYGPLLRLGRIGDARSLLLEYREIVEREHITADLGKVLSSLADVEDKAGHGHDAIELERNALRYKYLVGEVEALAVSHHNLGNYLGRHTADYTQALAHHLAAALLRSLTGTGGGASRSLGAAAEDLARLPGGDSALASISQLCDIAGEVPGVRLDRLLAQLTDDPAAAQGALDALLTQARADPNARFARYLAAWDPVIAGITAARDGDGQARADVEQHLGQYRDSADWGKLAIALRSILQGGPDVSLPSDLDDIDTAITRRAMAVLNGAIQLPGQLWQALPLTPLIGGIVAAAYGDQDATRQASDMIAALGEDSDVAPLADTLRRILNGDRAPALADGLDPAASAAVTAVLTHLPRPDRDRLPPATWSVPIRGGMAE
jgi:hypothetical protein